MSPCSECHEKYVCKGWCPWNNYCMDCKNKFKVTYKYEKSYNINGGTLYLEKYNYESSSSEDDFFSTKYSFPKKSCDHKDCKVKKCCGTLIDGKHKKWCFYPLENSSIKHIFEDQKNMLTCKICDEKIIGDISNIKEDSEFYNYITYCKNPKVLDKKMDHNLKLINEHKILLDEYTNIYNSLKNVKEQLINVKENLV